MKHELVKALLKHYPSLNPKIVERQVQQYIVEFVKHLRYQYLWVSKEQLNQGVISFSESKFTQQAGVITINGKKEHMSLIMRKHPDTQIYRTTYVGNGLSKKVSEIQLFPKYKGTIMTEMKQQILSELNSWVLQRTSHPIQVDLTPPDEYTDYTPINWQSLVDFITNCCVEWDKTNKGQAYRDRLIRNATQALKILENSHLTNQGYYFYEQRETKNTGRVYGKGLSLISVPREVRHAALGICYKYDLRAASMCILRKMALDIKPDLLTGAITDYIKQRSEFRQYLAASMMITEEQAKEIITSLGFGAEVKDSPFTEIRRILSMDENFQYHDDLGRIRIEQLKTNQPFMMLYNKIREISDIVYDGWKKRTLEIGSRSCSQLDPLTNRRSMSKNQVLAWLYQATESAIMELTMQAIDSDNLLLRVHDCIYVKNPLPKDTIVTINHNLNEVYPGLIFECKRIQPVGTKTQPQALKPLTEHEKFIMEEERRAEEYFSIHTDNRPVENAEPMEITPWGLVPAGMYKQHQTEHRHFPKKYHGGNYE